MKKERLKESYSFKNLASRAELHIYGLITYLKDDYGEQENLAPQQVVNFLNTIDGKDLDIYINSPGGNIFGGMAIYNMLKRHKGKIRVYIDGLVGSICSVIALAGDEVYIPSNSYFMIHRAEKGAYGNADDLRKAIESLETMDEGIFNVYRENFVDGVSEEEVKEMIKKETWLTGEQAQNYFNVMVVAANDAVACVDLESYKVPEDLKVRIEAANLAKTKDTDEQNRIAKAKLALKLKLK